MKFLVVDDHQLIRDALHDVLAELKHGAVILEAATSAQAMQTIAEHTDTKLVLLDLTLPDRDGFSVLEELRRCYPTIAVIVLSANQDRSNVLKALRLGALGYIPKSMPRDVMLNAIQLVFAGSLYVPPQVLDDDAIEEATSNSPSRERIAAWCAQLGLKERQLDVLVLMMQGKSNKAICRMLDLSEATVKNYVTSILKTLKVTNRTEAVATVHRLGRKPRMMIKT